MLISSKNLQLLPQPSSSDDDDVTSDINSDEDSDVSVAEGQMDNSWQDEAMMCGELFHLRHSDDVTGNSDVVTKTAQVDVEGCGFYGGGGKKLDLLANMLGIISLKANPSFPQADDLYNDDIVPIRVDALVPGGAAYKCGYVRLGDVLTSIDGVEVDAHNIHEVLFSVTTRRKLKLDFRSSLSPDEITTAAFPNQLRPQSHHVTNSEVKLASPMTSQSIPTLDKIHGVFYLKLKQDGGGGDDENDDVTYQYPAEANELLHVRGIFITVFDLIKENFHSDDVTSSTVYVDGDMVHCTYHHDARNASLLVICYPASEFTLQQAKQTTVDVVTLIRVMYGSLQSAFADRRYLLRHNHFFKYVFLLNSNLFDANFQPLCYPGVHTVTLQSEVDAQLRGLLTEFESNDFVDGFNPNNRHRRLFTVQSSCLFHAGYMLVNHMSARDLRHVQLFCFNHGLFTAARHKQQQIGLLIIWREAHDHTKQQQQRKFSRKSAAFKTATKALKQRTFWLIVGLKSALLCSIVRMNVGSSRVGAVAGGVDDDTHPRPPVSIVNVAHATLLQFHHSGYFRDVERACVTSQSRPPITLAATQSRSTILSAMPSSPLQGRSFRIPSFLSSSLKGTSNETTAGSGDMSKLRSSSSFKRTDKSNKKLFREKSFSSQDSDAGGLMTSSNSESCDVTNGYRYLTFGDESNGLYCYVSDDGGNATFRAPTNCDVTVGSDAQREIIRCFRRCAFLLRHRLEDDAAADGCCETGMKFELKVSSKTLHEFWVAARRRRKTLLFVCYNALHSEQNLMELAFRFAGASSSPQ